MSKLSTRFVGACIAVALAGTTGVAATHATHPDDSVGPLEAANAQLSMQTSLEGMVLLDNHNKALPIGLPTAEPNIALFGCGAMSTVKGGTGSGAVNNRASGNISARKGFEDAGYNITTSPAYWSALDLMDVDKASAANKTAYRTNNSCATYETLYAEWAPWKNFQYEATGITNNQYTYNNPIYPDTNLNRQTVQPTAATDTAFYFVSRNSGEHWDRYASEGDYKLSYAERANIQLIGQTYKNVIVVINVGGIIDVKFVDEINNRFRDPAGGDPVDGVFLMSQAGQAGGAALPQVLNGTESPSGKLTDTWATDYSYYPSADTYSTMDYSGKIHFPDTFGLLGPEENYKTENYSEGIYVGYRYFDSFDKKIPTAVQYPFGFGLSYTDFNITTDSVTASLTGDVVVKATVQNVGGTYTGKEVVEVYFSAPQTGLDKPYQELVGFGKTEKLAPGQKQQLTITFPATELSSYDEAAAAYVMEAGDYVIRVGNSSRNTHVGAVLNLPSNVVTEQLSNQFRGDSPADELTSDPADFYSYPGEAAEITAAPRVALSTAGFTTQNRASTIDQSVAIPSTDPMASVEGSKISTTTAYLSSNNPVTNWEGTGAPYAVQTARGETAQNVTTTPGATLYDVYRGTLTMEQFVAGLGVDVLSHLVVGRSGATSRVPSAPGSAGYTTEEYENTLGIPKVAMPDGPAGLRITQQGTANGQPYWQFATAFPVAMMLAQSFNPQLIQAVGDAVGAEMDEYGATWWLAPALNLHRNPLCGRNFEYYSEDPLVSGLTAAYITLGVQAHPGRGVTLKHYAANNQEVYRSNVDEIVSERTLREMYLKGFQIAVEMSQPMAIMSSYNKINGVAAFQDYDLQSDVLRGEWDFKGLVMTDWSSVIRGGGSFLATQYAGNDLIMPGSGRYDDIRVLIKPVAPAINGVTGLPVVGDVIFDTSVGTLANTATTARNTQLRKGFVPMLSAAPVNPSQGYPNYTYDAQSNFRASASGTTSFSQTVNWTSKPSGQPGALHLPVTPAASTISGPTVLGTVTNPTINSVNDAYEFIRLITSPAVTSPATADDHWTNVLSADEKAAITLSDEVYDASVPPQVTSYKVTLKGNYDMGSLRLGDLQRNVINILNVTMRSEPFQYLADLDNERKANGQAITVEDYSHLWPNLTTVNQSTPGAIERGGLPTTPPNAAGSGAQAGGLSGTPTVGSTVEVTAPAYWPTGTTVAYQWYADGVAIAGATNAEYLVQAADQGKVISATVTGTNPDFEGSTSVSFQFDNSVALVPGPQPTPTITKTAPPVIKIQRVPGPVVTVNTVQKPATQAKVTTKSVKVSGKAFKKGTKVKIKVKIKLSKGKAKGKVAIFVGKKRVKTVKVSKTTTSVKLPKRYAKKIKVKAKYTPTSAKFGTAKTSKAKTIKVKK